MCGDIADATSTMRLTLLMMVDILALLFTMVVFWLLYISTAAPAATDWEEDHDFPYDSYDPL